MILNHGEGVPSLYRGAAVRSNIAAGSLDYASPITTDGGGDLFMGTVKGESIGRMEAGCILALSSIR